MSSLLASALNVLHADASWDSGVLLELIGALPPPDRIALKVFLANPACDEFVASRPEVAQAFIALEALVSHGNATHGEGAVAPFSVLVSAAKDFVVASVAAHNAEMSVDTLTTVSRGEDDGSESAPVAAGEASDGRSSGQRNNASGVSLALDALLVQARAVHQDMMTFNEHLRQQTAAVTEILETQRTEFLIILESIMGYNQPAEEEP